MKVSSCLQLSFSKIIHLFFCEKVVAIVNWLRPNSNLWNVAQWLETIPDEYIKAILQIYVDIAWKLRLFFRIQLFMMKEASDQRLLMHMRQSTRRCPI